MLPFSSRLQPSRSHRSERCEQPVVKKSAALSRKAPIRIGAFPNSTELEAGAPGTRDFCHWQNLLKPRRDPHFAISPGAQLRIMGCTPRGVCSVLSWPSLKASVLLRAVNSINQGKGRVSCCRRNCKYSAIERAGGYDGSAHA